MNSRYIDQYFILASSCRAVKGANRSIIVDYLRHDLRIIPNEYYDLIQVMDRKKLPEVLELIDKDSASAFYEFVEFMIQHEFGLLVKDLSSFPERCTKTHDDHVIIKDCIIEVSPDGPEVMQIFLRSLQQIDELNCDDLQVRILGRATLQVVHQLLDHVMTTDINYVEIHCDYGHDITEKDWCKTIENYSTLSKVFLYNAPKNNRIEHCLRRAGHPPLLMGIVYHLDTPLSAATCGIITMDSLSFESIGTYDLLKNHNGCLYKKVTINDKGEIKNCPYSPKTNGKITDVHISNILKTDEFRRLWNIKKDEINICKDCEFRYNCTDCRAFLSDENDLYSKPLKCGYNPYTNVWEECSKNELRNITDWQTIKET